MAATTRLASARGSLLPSASIAPATERFDEQVDRAVSANPEIEELVRNLEAAQEGEFEPSQDVPSADDIAQEFQRFLRQRGTDKN